MNDNIATGSAPSTGGLIAYFAANSVAANLMMVFLIIAGIIAGSQLAVRNWPEFSPGVISITVPSPGSSAEEVFKDINQFLEKAVVGIDGVDRVESIAKDNVGYVEITVETFSDAKDVLDDVSNAVVALESFPPLNADKPEIELTRNVSPVMTIAVYSSNRTENELRREAERLQNHLLALPGVTLVGITGSRDREISIELDEVNLRRHGLDIRDLAKVIRSNSLNLSFGNLRSSAGDISLNIIAKRNVGEDFGNIPLITRLNGTVVRLEDVAKIRDSFVDERVSTELDGVPAIFVQVDAATDHSQLGIRNTVKDFLAGYDLSEGINQIIWDDDAANTFDNLRGIIDNAIIGAVLVFLCLAAVFDLRSAFWITLGIPLSFIGSLVLFHPAGLTLNQGTLFAFFLLIGIVVDDAVVVGESIIAHRKKGISGLEASISGARMVFGPLFVGAITTLLALFPLMFIDTGIGQVVKVIPVVAAFVLAISLLEAFLILPAHLANDKPWSAPPLSNWQRAVRNYLDKLRDTVVLSTASWAVRNSWLALLLTIFLIVGAFLLLRFETIPVVFADGREGINNTIRVEITMPAGTPFAITEKMADHFREAALMVNEEYEGKAIKSISTVVGSILTTRSDENDRYGENIAMVNAQLFDKENRSAEILEIEKAWRQFVGQTDQIENVEYFTTVIKTKPNLSYSLRHEDFAVLQDAAASIQAEMANISGIFDIKDNLKYGNRQFEIQITPEGEVAGFTPANIGTQLRARLYGLEVQRLQRGNEEIKVIVNYPEQSRTSISDLSNIRLDRPGKGQVPLSAIARIVEKQELEEITQLDGSRVVYVNAKADTATITPRNARKLLENGIVKDLTEKYPDLIIDRAGSALDERDTLNTLILLVPLSLLAIYLLMAAFLRSYWKPIIAAAGIPLTFVGAVLAHLILGWNFTFISIFGIIAASGVVVNDGLVLLDRYESIRRESPSLPAVAALVSATRLRFRPVLLTSLTTVLGLSPLLYERSDVLLHMVPFAASILGGLIMSGLYVLFLMPAMVMIVEGRDE